MLKQKPGQRLAFLAEADVEILAECLVALANGDGGLIVLGLNENGRPTTPIWEEEAEGALLEAARHCHPPVPTRWQQVETPQGTLIGIEVPRSTDLHTLDDGRVLIRSSTVNRPLTGDEVRNLANSKNTAEFETELVPGARYTDLDRDIVQDYLDRREQRGQARTLSTRELLFEIGATDRSGHPTTTGIFNVNLTATDSRGASSSAAFTWTFNNLLALNSPPAAPAIAVNATASYTISSTGGVNPRYRWSWGDGTADSPLSNVTTVSHIFSAPGRYQITITATDDTGRIVTATFHQTVHAALTALRPTASGSIFFEDRPTGTNDRLWCVNGDNNSVSVFDTVTRARLAEITVGTAPRALAQGPDGRVWVSNVEAGTISIISGSTLAVVQTLTLPRGSRPFGIAFDPDGTDAWIACEGIGRLLRFNPTSATQLASVDVGLHEGAA